MKKKTLAALLTLGIIVAGGYFGTTVIKADDVERPVNILASRIAEKFGLNESDVEAVMTAVHEEHMQQMQDDREERLNQAVSDGVITEDQKNAILSKMQENAGERKQNREEMQAWFQSQGIDETKLHEYLGFGPHKGPGPREGMGFEN